jgi:hypothetical protein
MHKGVRRFAHFSCGHLRHLPGRRLEVGTNLADTEDVTLAALFLLSKLTPVSELAELPELTALAMWSASAWLKRSDPSLD